MSNFINNQPRLTVVPNTTTKTPAEKLKEQANQQQVKEQQTVIQQQTQLPGNKPEMLQQSTSQMATYGKSLVRVSKETKNTAFTSGPIDIAGRVFNSREELEAFVNDPANQAKYEALIEKSDEDVLYL